jgi:hypothetical protein
MDNLPKHVIFSRSKEWKAISMRLAVLLAVMMAACVVMIALAQDPGVNGRYPPDYWQRLEKASQQKFANSLDYWRLEKPAQQAADADAPKPVADVPKTAPGTYKAWYQQTTYPTKCVKSDLSPADSIQLGVQASVPWWTDDYGDPSNPSKVNLYLGVGDDKRLIATYWGSIEACESDLPKTQPIPSKYR